MYLLIHCNATVIPDFIGNSYIFEFKPELKIHLLDVLKCRILVISLSTYVFSHIFSQDNCFAVAFAAG